MRIVIFPSDDRGCGFYRCIVPAEIIKINKLAEVRVSHEVKLELMEWGDIFVWQRQYRPGLFNIAKSYAHKKHIFELDDDLFNISPDNPVYKAYQNKDIISKLREFIQFCDHVICSTEPLKEVLLQYNKNVTVIPNGALDNYKVPPVKKDISEPLRVGWQGSMHHYNDLKFITHSLVDLCDKYDNIKIVFMGWIPDYIKNAVPKDKLELHDWVPFKNYLDYLQTLRIDVGLAPLEDNKFNVSKSALRYYENSLMGTCTVASNIYPYTNAITHDTDGIIVPKNRHKDWTKAIDYVISNPLKRYQMAVNAQNKVIMEHSYYRSIQLWMNLYEEVYDRKKVVTHEKIKIPKYERQIGEENNIPITYGRYTPNIYDIKTKFVNNRYIDYPSIKKILIIKLDHIGDFILSLPAIKLMREKFPKAEITLLTASWNKLIADRLDEIDNVLVFDFFNQVSEKGINSDSKKEVEIELKLKSEGYNLAVDLRMHPETRNVLMAASARYSIGYAVPNKDNSWMDIALVPTKEHMVDYIPHITAQMCSLVNTLKTKKKINIELPKINFTEEEKNNVKEKYSDILSNEVIIGINPGVGTLVRQWPIEYYSKLIDIFIEKDDAHIVLFGAPSEIELVNEVYDKVKHKENVSILAGKASLLDFALLIKHCDLFIGNNSGSGHIAGIMDIPTLIVFNGQVLPSQWQPLGKKSGVIKTVLPCAPCYYGFKEQCHRNMSCMVDIKPELVYKLGDELIYGTHNGININKICNNIKGE